MQKSSPLNVFLVITKIITQTCLNYFQDLIVKGCSSTLCPLEEMKQALEPYMLDDKTFNEICASDILDIIAQGKYVFEFADFCVLAHLLAPF